MESSLPHVVVSDGSVRDAVGRTLALAEWKVGPANHCGSRSLLLQMGKWRLREVRRVHQVAQ